MSESKEERRERMRALGRKGGAAYAAKMQAKAAVRADLRAREAATDAAEEMMTVLIQAAKGQGDFDKLDPKERVAFALKVLEYGVGRPRPVDAASPVETQGPGGLSFTVGAAPGTGAAHAIREPSPEEVRVRNAPAVGDGVGPSDA